jgi:hypothetical protein
MIEITNIEYNERPAAGGHAGAQPYRSLVFWVRLSDDTACRFLVDQQAIRMLDAPSAKGVLLRRNVEKIVIRMHSDTIFSVVVFIRRGLAERARSRVTALFPRTVPANSEDIGTSLQGFDGRQVAEWLRNLGYHVELMAVAPWCQPTVH